MDITAPSLNHNDIKLIAKEFLDYYHSGGTIPIPIEEIVELDMKIHLISVPNLKKDFGIVAFINSTFDTITIDDYVFEHFEERARFSIAHEIGHIQLHEKIYREMDIQTIEEYLLFQDSMKNQTYSLLERQANDFAGAVLIPGQTLSDRVDICNRAEQRVEAFRQLPERFKVSPEALKIQIEKERIVLPSDIFRGNY